MTNPDGPRPRSLAIPQADLDDLADRLTRTRWPAGPADPDRSRGVPIGELRQLVDRWRAAFDWRAVEDRLNQWDPTVATVDGQEILFLHARSPEAGALPLVLAHGYPGSPVEFLDVLGPLSDPAGHGGDHGDAFHVVVPALPGFGLAPPVREHGWTTTRMAGVFKQIVGLLGYERYGVQGGDVGAGIAQDMASADPAGVVGVHVNTDMLATAAVLSFAGVTLDPADFDESERPLVERMSAFVRDGLGYIALQGTRPATVGYALDDSPVGLLAWIAEKFEEWTDLGHDGPSRTVDADRLLANVTAYWLHRNGSASAHFLYDAQHAEQDWGTQVDVPRGWAVFGGGGSVVRRLMDPRREIPHWTEHAEGGHFAALEAPDSFVEDVRTFFRPLR
jgi:pimeloyl-ACP methyl ester carboxylesterase